MLRPLCNISIYWQNQLPQALRAIPSQSCGPSTPIFLSSCLSFSLRLAIPAARPLNIVAAMAVLLHEDSNQYNGLNIPFALATRTKLPHAMLNAYNCNGCPQWCVPTTAMVQSISQMDIFRFPQPQGHNYLTRIKTFNSGYCSLQNSPNLAHFPTE